jgi:hypothetical protein
LRCRGTIRAERVEGEVWERVQRILERPDIIAKEVERQDARAEEQREELQQEAACLDTALTKCDREGARWDEAYAREVISLDELKLYRADIATRRQQILTERAQRQAQMGLVGQAAGQATQLMAYCSRISQQLQTFDLADKRLALKALDIRVRWTPGEDFDVQGTIPLDGLWPSHPRGVEKHPGQSGQSPGRAISRRHHRRQDCPRAVLIAADWYLHQTYKRRG